MKKKNIETVEDRLEMTIKKYWKMGDLYLLRKLNELFLELLKQQRHSIISLLSETEKRKKVLGFELHENPFLKEGEWGLLPGNHRVDTNTAPKHSWRDDFDRLLEDKNVNYVAVVPLFNFIQDLLIKQKQQIILNIKAWHYNEFSPDVSCLNDCPKKIIAIINNYKI